MTITENQAIEYLTGLALAMKKKIEIYDSNRSDNTDSPIDIDDFFVTQDERLMCGSLELVLQKAKSNVMFTQERDS